MVCTPSPIIHFKFCVDDLTSFMRKNNFLLKVSAALENNIGKNRWVVYILGCKSKDIGARMLSVRGCFQKLLK